MGSDPYAELSLEQIENVVEAQTRIQEMRGVFYADLEYLVPGGCEAASVAHLYPANEETLKRLPDRVGG